MADLCCQRGRRPKSPDRLARWVAGGLVDADTAAQLRAERLALAGGRPVRAITLRAAALVVTGLVGVGVGMALDSPEPEPAPAGPGTVVFTTTVGIVQ
jgi:hypothetical protein